MRTCFISLFFYFCSFSAKYFNPTCHFLNDVHECPPLLNLATLKSLSTAVLVTFSGNKLLVA